MPAIYDCTSRSAGDEISSTYEGRHLTLEESLLVHPSHTDDLVDKGDPVVVGKIVGVAFNDAEADTDLIAIDTEGIWALNVKGEDSAGNAAVSVGDRIYIDPASAELDIDNTKVPFGYALGAVAAGATTLIAVKVHAD